MSRSRSRPGTRSTCVWQVLGFLSPSFCLSRLDALLQHKDEEVTSVPDSEEIDEYPSPPADETEKRPHHFVGYKVKIFGVLRSRLAAGGDTQELYIRKVPLIEDILHCFNPNSYPGCSRCTPFPVGPSTTVATSR